MYLVQNGTFVVESELISIFWLSVLNNYRFLYFNVKLNKKIQKSGTMIKIRI